MIQATAIIGTNFGDEGKGLMTDYHCSGHGAGTIVVRFNGGAQAGHTVQVPGGARHVFHHLGAGTLAGSPTYLSRFFIVNPLLWRKEIAELAAIHSGLFPLLYVDRDAPLSTPYDMLVNQEVERARGRNRHGSCGVGINETIERIVRGRPATHVRDIENPALLRARLLEIRAGVPGRLAEHGIECPDDGALAVIASDVLVEHFLEAAEELRASASFVDAELLRAYGRVVFEGAQGLLLDELHRFFPYVTRSRTGLHNVMELAAEVGIEALNVVYVTRAYMTRHGAGPFPTEDPELRYDDRTNVPNEYQGGLRFGWMDLDLLAASIADDRAGADSGIVITPRLAVTCLDQVGEEVRYLQDRMPRRTTVRHFLAAAFDAAGVESGYVSHGPTRSDVRMVHRRAPRPA